MIVSQRCKYLEIYFWRNLNLEYKKICILDTETTDKYWNTSAPVQLAALICDSEGNILDKFNERIKQENPYSKTQNSASCRVNAETMYTLLMITCRNLRK